MKDDQPTLDFALLILLEAVDRLTKPYKIRVISELDNVPEQRLVVLPPMLRQLNDAIKSSQSSTRRGITLANERSVIDASALMLEGAIQDAVRGLWSEVCGSDLKPRTLQRQLTRWHVEFRRLATDGQLPAERVWQVAKLVQGWTKAIDLKFDPPVTLEVTRPCPACNAAHVFDFMGDRVASVVISWRRSFDDSAAICRACSKSWVGEAELRQLRWDLDTLDELS
jgi:hypothetical protein